MSTPQGPTAAQQRTQPPGPQLKHPPSTQQQQQQRGAAAGAPAGPDVSPASVGTPVKGEAVAAKGLQQQQPTGPQGAAPGGMAGPGSAKEAVAGAGAKGAAPPPSGAAQHAGEGKGPSHAVIMHACGMPAGLSGQLCVWQLCHSYRAWAPDTAPCCRLREQDRMEIYDMASVQLHAVSACSLCSHLLWVAEGHLQALAILCMQPAHASCTYGRFLLLYFCPYMARSGMLPTWFS